VAAGYLSRYTAATEYLLARCYQAFSDFPVGVCGCPTQRPWCPFCLGFLIAVFTAVPYPATTDAPSAPQHRHARVHTQGLPPLRLQSQVYHVQRLTSYYTLSVSSISSLHMASPKPWQCIVHGSGSTFSSLCGRHDDVKFLVCMQELSISQLRSPTKHLVSRIV
jgi:hypothetical protein